MSAHTPVPWIAATKYSSVAGVPIVAQTGKRIGNTAGPDWPPEWDQLKRDAEANAALIVRAVNRDHHFDALVKALEEIEDLGANGATAARLGNIAHAALIAVLAVVGGSRQP